MRGPGRPAWLAVKARWSLKNLSSKEDRPLPKIKARDSKGRSCLQADRSGVENPEGRKRVCASPDAQRVGGAEGLLSGAVLREGSRVLRHR